MPKFKQKISMFCSRCVKEYDKVAYFFSESSMWDNSTLCRKCFVEVIKKLPIKEQKEWNL